MTSLPVALYIQAMLKKFRYALEGGLILFALLFFRLLPLDFASALAGCLARMAGPFSRAHRTARSNLEQMLPELSEYQRAQTLSAMWDNLGRVIGEYPHLSRPVMAKRITVEGLEHLERVKQSGEAALFVSGHFANWEIIPLTAGIFGLPMTVIYREANNPVAEWLIRRIRAPYTRSMFGKGRQGAAQTIRALKEGHPVAMLIDQKQNDGQPVPFFGRDAMTSTAPAQLAIKYELPVLAAHVVRTDGAYFHLRLEPPVSFGADTDPVSATADLNRLLETWIRQYPAQWFWVHRRWG